MHIFELSILYINTLSANLILLLSFNDFINNFYETKEMAKTMSSFFYSSLHFLDKKGFSFSLNDLLFILNKIILKKLS